VEVVYRLARVLGSGARFHLRGDQLSQGRKELRPKRRNGNGSIVYACWTGVIEVAAKEGLDDPLGREGLYEKWPFGCSMSKVW
jgi:hypothetical protein